MQVRAARLIEHGAPLRVETVELADPDRGEAVVEVSYAGVNPVDRYGALGRVAADGPLPRTLGSEASGTVDGRRVVVRGHGLGQRRDGVFAERVVVPESALIDVPDRVDLRDAAAVGVAGVTAWRCVHEIGQVTSEDRVLVLGASGGVGSMIVSLATSCGALVWGQTASDEKVAFIAARGAGNVVVADAEELAAAVADFRPTAVFDPLGDGFTGAAIEAMAPRGRLVLFGTSAEPVGMIPLQQLYRKAIKVLGYAGLIESDQALAAGIRKALDAVASGDLEVVVDAVLPLEEVNDAFERLVQRSVKGKLLLDPRS
jgi:NADPH2:quinone reductase